MKVVGLMINAMVMGYIDSPMGILMRGTGTSIRSMATEYTRTHQQERAIVECGKQGERKVLVMSFMPITSSVVRGFKYHCQSTLFAGLSLPSRQLSVKTSRQTSEVKEKYLIS